MFTIILPQPLFISLPGAVLAVFTLAGTSLSSFAQSDQAVPTQLPEVVVAERFDSLSGVASSANEGGVGAEQLALRPLLRPREILETVPGVIVSQHSGALFSARRMAPR